MENSLPSPKKTLGILKSISIILGISLLIYPWIPQEVFIAKNPIDNSVFEILRGHDLWVPFNLAWAFEGIREIPAYIRILLIIALLAIPLIKTNAVSKLKPNKKLPSYIFYPLVFIVSSLLFFLLKVPHEVNSLFGDGSTLPNEIDLGWIFGAEVLTCYFFIFVRKIFDIFSEQPNGLMAIKTASIIAGGVFTTSMAFFARTIAKDRKEKLLLFLSITLSGYLIMFFGYVETTGLELAAIGAYFAFAVRFIYSKSKKTLWLFLSIASLSIAFMAHAAGIMLVGSLLVLLIERKISRLKTALNTIRPRNILFTLAIIVIPYYLLIYKPFYLVGNFGNIGGGGDGIQFVPWAMSYANPVSKFVYYSLISWWHFADILSIFLIASTFSGPLIILGLILAIKDKVKFDFKELKVITFLGLAAFGTIPIPILWNHDFGMWGDWNLSATYLFPLNIFGWIFFITISRKYKENKAYYKTLLCVLSVQILFALSLYLQMT